MNIAEYINANTSVFLSVIALIASILSPVLTTWLNNRHNLKLRKLELEHERRSHDAQFYDQHRAEVIERYINAAGKAARLHNMANETEFGSAMGEIYLYVDESEWPLLQNIENSIKNGDKTTSTNALTELCKALAKKGVRTKE